MSALTKRFARDAANTVSVHRPAGDTLGDCQPQPGASRWPDSRNIVAFGADGPVNAEESVCFYLPCIKDTLEFAAGLQSGCRRKTCGHDAAIFMPRMFTAEAPR